MCIARFEFDDSSFSYAFRPWYTYCFLFSLFLIFASHLLFHGYQTLLSGFLFRGFFFTSKGFLFLSSTSSCNNMDRSMIMSWRRYIRTVGKFVFVCTECTRGLGQIFGLLFFIYGFFLCIMGYPFSCFILSAGVTSFAFLF